MDEVRVLGSLEVVVRGLARSLGGPRRRRLLSVLVLSANRVVPNDRLLDQVWGVDAGSGGLRSLRTEVSRLRPTLDGVASIVAEGGGYRLMIDPERLDVARFEALVREAVGRDKADPGDVVDLLDAALALWRGRPYVEIADTLELAVGEVQRLDELRVSAVTRRAEAQLLLASSDNGGLSEVVGRLRSLLEEHPLQERLWALLMTALYRSGRQADALAAFQQARKVLVEDLGLEPSAELVSLEQQILEHDLALDPQSPAQDRTIPGTVHLPRPRSTLVGRDDDVNELLSHVTQRRIVCIVGPGGAGKTRTAIAVGTQAVARFDGQVYFVDLSVVHVPAALPGAFLEGIRLQSEAGVAPLDLVAGRIGDRRALFVVDNCEHLIEAAVDAIIELTDRCGGASVLATSREPLGADGEQVYRLPALASNNLDSSAVRLFTERARAADSEFNPDPADLAIITEICQNLDGMPLAIELAAARVRSLTVAEIADRLGERFGLLTATGRGAPPRHQTLRSALEWSIDLLDDDERALLRRLGVFVGGWRLASLAPVTGVDDRAALSLLDSLVAKSLVDRQRSNDGSTRYRLAETVREWAIEQCEQEQELEELRRRHAEHLRAGLNSWSSWRHSAPDFFRHWRPEAPNLVASVNWLAASDPALTVDLLSPTVEVFVIGGKGPWCLDALESNLASSLVQEDRRLFGLTRLMLGSLLMLDRDRAAAARSQALAEPPSITDAHAYFAASAAIGAVTADPHNSEPVIASVESFRDTATDPDAFESLCTALHVNQLALIGHHPRAIEAFLDGPSGLDIGGVWVSSAASSALVCAYITKSPQLERIAGMTKSMNRCDPLYDGGADALLTVTGPGSVQKRCEALASMAHNGAYNAMASYEAIYLACFARLAHERGDRDRAKQLLDATSMRSAAISALMKATHVQLHDLSPETETSRVLYQDFFAHRRTPDWDERTSATRLLDEELRNWS